MLRDVTVTLFLAVLYAAVRIIADADVIRTALRAYVSAVAVAGLLGVAGLAFSWAGLGTSLLVTRTPYPFVGTVLRARALTATPNMLASLIMLALFILVAGEDVFQRRRGWLVAGFFASFVATFSKSVVPLVAGLVVVLLARSIRGRSARRRVVLGASAWLASLVVYALPCHVMVVPRGENASMLQRSMYVGSESLLEFEILGKPLSVVTTNYWVNKRASLIAIRRSWPFGVGPGGYAAFTETLRREGLYPAMPWRTPHSTYTGTVAELGLTGGIGLLALAITLAIVLGKGLARPEGADSLIAAATAMFVASSIEAIATDVMHFRHYTWLAALAASAGARSRG